MQKVKWSEYFLNLLYIAEINAMRLKRITNGRIKDHMNKARDRFLLFLKFIKDTDLSSIQHAANWAHNTGSPGTKHFQNPTRFQCPQQLSHFYCTLRHLELSLWETFCCIVL